MRANVQQAGSSFGLWVEGEVILPLWDVQDVSKLLVLHMKDAGEGVLHKNKEVFISALLAPV